MSLLSNAGEAPLDPVPPTAPVVGLDDVKDYLRIDDDDQDAMLSGLILAAQSLCEQFIGQVLLTRHMEEIIPATGRWHRLGATPVRAITSVDGLPMDGAAFTLPVDAYAIDIDANGDGWVRIDRHGVAERLTVTYDAGMASSWTGVPEGLRLGITRLVAHLFASRDRADDGGPPLAVAALWRPWRRMRLQ